MRLIHVEPELFEKDKIPLVDTLFNKNWDKFLDNITNTVYFQNLCNFININYRLFPSTFFPSMPHRIFESFDRIGPSDVDVVFLGGEPRYDSKSRGFPWGSSSGLKHNEWPDELKLIDNCIKEYNKEVDKVNTMVDSDLFSWISQGVLPLHSSLTSLLGKPMEHNDIWEPFVSKLLKTLCEKRRGITFVLFGMNASTYYSILSNYTSVELGHRVFFEIDPVSILKERRRTGMNIPFKTSVFKQINKLFADRGQAQIWW